MSNRKQGSAKEAAGEKSPSDFMSDAHSIIHILQALLKCAGDEVITDDKQGHALSLINAGSRYAQELGDLLDVLEFAVPEEPKS